MSEETKKFFCNKCQDKTNHFVRANYQKEEVDCTCKYLPSYLFNYVVAECCGCNNFSFIRQFWDNQSDNFIYSYDPDTAKEQREIDWYEEIYPPVNYRQIPVWLNKLDDEILEIVLLEVHRALQAESTFLAAFGCRTLLERFVYITTGTVVDNLACSLKTLENHKILSEGEYKHLDLVKEAGDASAHRAWNPEKDQLGTIIDIIEGMIHRYIILENEVEEIKSKIPPRPKKVK